MTECRVRKSPSKVMFELTPTLTNSRCPVHRSLTKIHSRVLSYVTLIIYFCNFAKVINLGIHLFWIWWKMFVCFPSLACMIKLLSTVLVWERLPGHSFTGCPSSHVLTIFFIWLCATMSDTKRISEVEEKRCLKCANSEASLWKKKLF